MVSTYLVCLWDFVNRIVEMIIKFREYSLGLSGNLSFSRAFGVMILSLITLSTASTVIPSSPSSGFSAIPVFQRAVANADVGGDDLTAILKRISTQVLLGSTYNSNIFQRARTAGFPVQDDIVSTLAGDISYMSKASTFTFGCSYRGVYNNYIDNSEFTTFNHEAGVSLNYEGGPLTSSFRVGIDYAAGSNRDFLGALITRTNYTSALNARYSVSPKTVLQASYNYNYTAVDEGGFDDTQSYDLETSALWKYSTLTEFGPGIRYTYRAANAIDGRTAIGPIFNINYRLSQKVSFSSRFGIDFPSFDSGVTVDPTFTTSFAATYNASRLWSINLSLYRDTQADPAFAGIFNEVTSARLGYLRNIRRVQFNCGVSYDINQVSGTGQIGGIDRNFMTFDTSLGMPLFSNNYYGIIFLRNSEQRADVADQTWDALQIGLNISRRF
jgi:hypothetical protein